MKAQSKRIWVILLISIGIFSSSGLFLFSSHISNTKEPTLQDVTSVLEYSEKEIERILSAGDLNGAYIGSDYIATHDYNDYLGEAKSRRYSFLGNNSLELITHTSSCFFEYQQDFGTKYRYISVESGVSEYNQLSSFQLSVTSQNYQTNWLNSHINAELDKTLSWYGTVYQFSSNDSADITFSIPFVFLEPFINSKDPYVYVGLFDSNGYASNGEWEILDMINVANFDNQSRISFEVTSYDANQESTTNSNQYQYTFTLFFPKIIPDSGADISGGSSNLTRILIGLLLLGGVGLILAMSKEEYRKFLVHWVAPRANRHQLNWDEIFENENRMKIIGAILQFPGIHYNQISRATHLKGGQLRWHLDVLLSYGVVKSKPVGQYVLYFPVNKTNPISEEDLAVVKSSSTLNILNIIRYSPGINGSKIADLTKMKRNSIKYHIDKLLERGIIYYRQEGRQKRLFYNKENEFFEDLMDQDDNLPGTNDIGA